MGKTAPSRLVYELTKETFYIQDLRLSLHLPTTRPYDEVLRRRESKRMDIDLDFYSTGAMMERNWTKENQPQRHTITRYAIHGFHHKICVVKKYHNPQEDCVCELCNGKCDKYHISKCCKRSMSLSEYSKN